MRERASRRSSFQGLYLLSLPLSALILAGVAVALSSPSRAFSVDPFGRAVSAYHTGEHDRARTLLEEILASDPVSRRAHRLMGRIALEEGRPYEAIPHLRKALSEDRKDFETLMILARACGAAGLVSEAARVYEEASNLQPENPLPLKEAGKLLAERGNAAMALVYLSKASRLDPADRETIELMSEVARGGTRRGPADPFATSPTHPSSVAAGGTAPTPVPRPPDPLERIRGMTSPPLPAAEKR